MHEILPSEQAKELCQKWIEELDSSSLGKHLMQDGNGKMFGLLICQDRTILKAFSGEISAIEDSSDFVPPCFDTEKMKALLQKADEDLLKETDKLKKREISRFYWDKVKELYSFHCFDSSVVHLSDLPFNAQSGTGDCCAPRLLSYCYSLGKRPLQLAEFFYGNGAGTNKNFYTPCDERCKPLLKYIIGLDIVYQDKDIVVVNKQSNVLAIEGRGDDKQDCIASRVRELYQTIAQPCVHRLDQATSGLMVLAKNQVSHDKLCLDFENRLVYKEYEALVEGKILENEGEITLPVRLDTDNRPHQIVDFEKGKPALTRWQNLGIEKLDSRYVTRLRLIPFTGRTHQLRVHCASGLGNSIVNDRLYGTDKGSRLMLMAKVLKFTHPTTNQEMCFELESEF